MKISNNKIDNINNNNNNKSILLLNIIRLFKILIFKILRFDNNKIITNSNNNKFKKSWKLFKFKNLYLINTIKK